jgi:GntR family transcriptional regulator, rspAB operon transcriptional repressor
VDINAVRDKGKIKIRESNASKVYKHLLSLLLNRKLVPGDRINRRTIAAELGLSVSPVAEAMLKLESEGLLVSIPRKGTLVGINSEDANAAAIMREAFECQIVRMCCGKPVRENEKVLIKLAEAVDRAPEGTMKNWEAEMRFHRKVVELAGCSALTNEFDKIIRRAFFCWANMLLLAHTNKPPGYHAKLIRKLKNKDPDYAEKAMREHLRRGQEMVKQYSD